MACRLWCRSSSGHVIRPSRAACVSLEVQASWPSLVNSFNPANGFQACLHTVRASVRTSQRPWVSRVRLRSNEPAQSCGACDLQFVFGRVVGSCTAQLACRNADIKRCQRHRLCLKPREFQACLLGFRVFPCAGSACLSCGDVARHLLFCTQTLLVQWSVGVG